MLEMCGAFKSRKALGEPVGELIGAGADPDLGHAEACLSPCRDIALTRAAFFRKTRVLGTDGRERQHAPKQRRRQQTTRVSRVLMTLVAGASP
jgi:hypothetical protein